ncbi:hypothetical protein [Streptomyces sp. NPDC005262]|uniref:hypothetical protein n=1 Tax=Streptomyces sp. NPDC005262 TaxID=3364710 RepID=UPI0036900478
MNHSRSFLQRIEAPQGGTSETELILSNGMHVHIELAREHSGCWGYALAPAD